MKNRTLSIFIIFIISFSIFSCRPTFYENPKPLPVNAGTISLDSYIAVGGAIEAGFADNTLYYEAQQFAFPNLLAAQFAIINTSLTFAQPTVISNSGYVASSTTNGKYVGKRTLQYPAGGCKTAGIVPTADSNGLATPEIFAGDKSKLTNLGVPFVSVRNTSRSLNQLTVSAASTNPYIYLKNIVSNGNESIASISNARNSSFFTLWIGYDEFLSIARSGITTTTGIGIDTSGLQFLINSLLTNPKSKGAIATIPYVDLFPIITNNNRRLASATDPSSYPGSRTVEGRIVKRLPTVSLAGFNAILGTNIFSTDSTKAQNYVITKGNGSLDIIKLRKDFLLNGGLADLQLGVGPQDSVGSRSCIPQFAKRQSLGLTKPIANNAVLDAEEILILRSLIDQYNEVLRNIVNKYPERLALVDMNGFITKLTDPLYGIILGATIIRTNHPALGPDFGGFFSTDRTYPTPKGQALIANEFIKSINSKWAATIPLLNIDNYRGNVIPD